MKKVIYLLVLCMVLGMAGCGTNQENKEPVSGNVSVETENKENDDVVQNEQIADTGSYPPCVMVDGVIYKDTGYVASMPGCGTMDGEIVSTVAGTELPSENNQSNFGSGYHYQRSSEGQLIVVIDDERIIFRDIEKDDTSIPIEVINFNAKVKISISKKKQGNRTCRPNITSSTLNKRFLLLSGQKTFYYNWQKRSIISLRYFLET